MGGIKMGKRLIIVAQEYKAPYQGTTMDTWYWCCCGSLVIGCFILKMVSGGACNNSHKKQHNVKEDPNIEERVNAEQGNYFSNFLLRQIEKYQQNISPEIKKRLNKTRLCRYNPSCSEYAKQAIKKKGSLEGSYMAVKRLLKCNPFSKGGEDPVN
jgi:hypothetical protein